MEKKRPYLDASLAWLFYALLPIGLAALAAWWTQNFDVLIAAFGAGLFLSVRMAWARWEKPDPYFRRTGNAVYTAVAAVYGAAFIVGVAVVAIPLAVLFGVYMVAGLSVAFTGKVAARAISWTWKAAHA